MTDQPTTTDLDAAIVDHLTRAQRHWLACGELCNDRQESRYHTTGHAWEVTTAFLAAVLKEIAPDRAEAIYLDLRRMLDHPPASGSWTWMELASRGIDPGSIVAFKPLKPADGTLSAALTPTVRHYVDELVEMAGKRRRREQLTAEDQRLVDDVRALLEQDPLPADGTQAEPSSEQDGAAA